MGRFKAPTLRNIAVTAPYMHDGSIATLEEVFDHYAAGGRTISDGPYAGVGSDSPSKGAFVRGFAMTDRDKADIVEFLKSLTDEELPHQPALRRPVPAGGVPGRLQPGRQSRGQRAGHQHQRQPRRPRPSRSASCGDPSGDGAVTIDELMRAIGGALDGCE